MRTFTDKRLPKNNAHKAFTMIELIAAVSIIAMLSVVLVVFIGNYITTARETSNRQTLAVLNDALTRYKVMGGGVDGLTYGADIARVLNDLRTPVDWAGVTHQFLKTSTTYSAASLEATGNGAQYRFFAYGGTYGEDVPVDQQSTLYKYYGDNMAFYHRGGAGTEDVTVTTTTGYIAYQINGGAPVIASGSPAAIPTPADSDVLMWSCAGAADDTQSGSITYFWGNNRELTEIDFEGCANMYSIQCQPSILTKVRVKNLANLEKLYVSNNPNLAQLDLTGCSDLRELGAGGLSVEHLDLTECPLIWKLWANRGAYKTINMTGCTAVEDPYFNDNPNLMTLDLTGCTSLDQLSVYESGIKTLILAGNTSLRDLNADNMTDLRTLDLTGCTGLTEVDFEGCRVLTDVTFTGCSNLMAVELQGTSVENIDLSGTPVTFLNCSYVGLTSLDLSGVNLATLFCDGNELTSLDLSGMTSLHNLDVDGNPITSLNLSGCTGLGSLDVSGISTLSTLTLTGCSGMSSLNISGCTALGAVNLADCANLTSFHCRDLGLTSLDVSGTSLTSLNCANNNLTSLNISGLNLYSLICNNNQLTSLDFSGHTNLIELECSVNKLTALSNLTGCTNLMRVTCSLNDLTSLDLSSCASMSSLQCPYNDISSLNLTGASGLEELNCAYNNLTTLDISDTQVYYMNADYNNLSSVTFMDSNWGPTYAIGGNPGITQNAGALESFYAGLPTITFGFGTLYLGADAVSVDDSTATSASWGVNRTDSGILTEEEYIAFLNAPPMEDGPPIE